MANFELYIVQDDCTGCTACPDYAAKASQQHFFMGDDGLAYVKEAGGPDEVRFEGDLGRVAVGDDAIEDVIAAAEDCPGMCIYVEAV